MNELIALVEACMARDGNRPIAQPAAPRPVAPQQEILDAIASPFTRVWVKNALRTALDRDCVDAAADAEYVANLLTRRADDILGRSANHPL